MKRLGTYQNLAGKMHCITAPYLVMGRDPATMNRKRGKPDVYEIEFFEFIEDARAFVVKECKRLGRDDLYYVAERDTPKNVLWEIKLKDL